MSRLEITKISLKDVERRRSELVSHRELLLRTLCSTAGIYEVTDILRDIQAALHPPCKRKTGKLNS